MPDAAGRSPFQYAIIRVVPLVERGECFNAGIVLFCRPLDYLAARTVLDRDLLRRLSPETDADTVQSHLGAVEQIAAGAPDCGPIARLSQSERFHWLVAPSSTIIQPSGAHTGLTDDPDAVLTRLFTSLVERHA